MDDYDYQLGLLRSSHAYKEYVQKDVANQLDSQVKAKNEDALFKLATEYQASTVGTLNRVLAQKLAALRFEEAEPSRLRWQMSFFNIWPLNMICKMFVEVKNGNE